MHIGLFVPNLGSGGSEKVTLTLSGALHRAGHQVSLVAASCEGPLAEAVPAGIELVGLGRRRVRSAVAPLSKWLKRTQPAVLISSQVHSNVVAFLAHRLARSSARLIVREDSTPTRNIGRMREPARSITRALMSIAYRGADTVVAVSSAAAADLQNFLPVRLERLAIVYNPVISANIAALANEEVTHAWFTERAPVILSVGRLSEEKDHSILIRALATMRAHADARLLILGEGPLRADLERLVASLGLRGRVSMPGFVANPYPYMSKADLFVLSSRFEGLPGVLIEALACGCRVVSTDCPSGPREILKQGALGMLVPVGDVTAMSLAMEASLSSSRGAAISAGDLEPYREQHSVAKYLELIGQT